MTVRFVVVPQWQGSPSSRAMRLVDGAEALRDDLPSAATTTVDVPLEAGDARGGGIARLSSLQLVRDRLDDVLAGLRGAGGPAPIVIGGDCSVSDAAITAASAASDRLAVIWFDAHPDLHSVETSPSHAYGGMVLRSLLDRGVVDASRVVLVGARAWDDAEDAYVAESPLSVVPSDAAGDASALAAMLGALDADAVYVHIDLDVLDPAELRGLLAPQPFGLSASDLVGAIRTAVESLPFAGGTVASYAPDSPEARVDDGPTLLRIIGALARPAEQRS